MVLWSTDVTCMYYRYDMHVLRYYRCDMHVLRSTDVTLLSFLSTGVRNPALLPPRSRSCLPSPFSYARIPRPPPFSYCMHPSSAFTCMLLAHAPNRPPASPPFPTARTLPLASPHSNCMQAARSAALQAGQVRGSQQTSGSSSSCAGRGQPAGLECVTVSVICGQISKRQKRAELLHGCPFCPDDYIACWLGPGRHACVPGRGPACMHVYQAGRRGRACMHVDQAGRRGPACMHVDQAGVEHACMWTRQVSSMGSTPF